MSERKRYRFVGLAILAANIAIVLGVKAGKGFPASFDLEPNKIRGNPNAANYLLEFSDYTCPYCAKLDPVLRKLLDAYPNLKLVLKVYPLSTHGEIAVTAAEAAECAGLQGKYWEYHDLLVEHLWEWFKDPQSK